MLQTPSPRRDRFVGRAIELGRLRAALEAAMAGAGGSVLLAGEAGIGKTRLAEELAAEAERRGARVLWGRCWEGEGAPAFWPWVQIVRAALRDQEPAALRATMGDGAADIAQIVPELRARLPDLPFPPSLPPEQARFRLFDSLTTFLKEAAERRPLLLILDDLHWADAASALLLRFLAAELADARLLLAGSYRDVEVDAAHPLTATLAALRRERTHERIALGGLAPAEIAALVRTAPPAGDAASVEQFALALHRETEGNPFFAGEILRHLVERGHPATAADLARIGVPDGVREVIGRRLARLSPACRALLDLAAVIGREFTVSALDRASAADTADGPELLALLDEGAAARLVAHIDAAPGSYRFAHALIRESLYDALPTARRAHLHRRAGEALEALAGPAFTHHLDALAHHFVEAAVAGDVAKAVTYLQKAAEHATAIYAYESAVDQYDTALRLLGRQSALDQRRRFDLLIALGVAAQRAADLTRLQAACMEAAAIARGLGDPDALVRAALLNSERGEFTARFDDVDLALTEEAHRAIGDATTAEAASVWATLSFTQFFRGDRAAALDTSAEALRIAHAVGEAEPLAAALCARHMAALAPGNAGERLEILDEALRVLGDGAEMTYFRAMRGWRLSALNQLGRMAEADADAAFMLERGRASRLTYFSLAAICQNANRALMDGRLAEAEAWLSRFSTARGQSQTKIAFNILEQILAVIIRREHRTEGEADALITDLRRLAVAPTGGSQVARCLITVLLCDAGRHAEAAQEFEVIAKDDLSGLQAEPFGAGLVFSACLLAEAIAALDDLRAGTLYRRLLPYADQNASWSVLTLMPVARALGLLATVTGQWDDATCHYREALDMSERVVARGWSAWTRHDWAAMLLKREAATGERADDEVRALLAAARETAETLGMMRLLAAVERLEAGAESRPDLRDPSAPASSFPDGLSSREAEVLRLIAQGRTNAEIAEALVLSVRTVERHAVNIYAKIGVRGRAEAVAYALRHGLLDSPP